jgi:hypothetical protein
MPGEADFASVIMAITDPRMNRSRGPAGHNSLPSRGPSDGAVLERLGHMLLTDGDLSAKVGDRSRHPEYAIKASGR